MVREKCEARGIIMKGVKYLVLVVVELYRY